MISDSVLSQLKHERDRLGEERRRQGRILSQAREVRAAIRADSDNRIDEVMEAIRQIRRHVDAYFRLSREAWHAGDRAEARAQAQQAYAEKAQLDTQYRKKDRLHEAKNEAQRQYVQEAQAYAQVKAAHNQARVAVEQRYQELQEEQERIRQAQARQGERAVRILEQTLGKALGEVVTKPDLFTGRINNYFGGEGSPDGPGHGHYAIDEDGVVVYGRDPGREHGPHNWRQSDGLGYAPGPP